MRARRDLLIRRESRGAAPGESRDDSEEYQYVEEAIRNGRRCGRHCFKCAVCARGMTLDTSTTYYGGWFSEEGALPPGVGSTEPAGNQTKCRMYIDGTFTVPF